ncbi:hypothetical protein [Rhizobium wenxiniae]|uniref:hypothetical protein n=1 Tax=Rhizobium wenxiniae TaxID=1737357 RepID=UPI003C2A8B0F
MSLLFIEMAADIDLFVEDTDDFDMAVIGTYIENMRSPASTTSSTVSKRPLSSSRETKLVA